MKDYKIEYFIENEKNGTRYCKIGKSATCNSGKGASLPYYDKIGEIVNVAYPHSITFEDVNIILNYLHYGDQLILINFTKGFNSFNEFTCYENPLNKGCFDANQVFVEDVLDLSNPKSIEYIVNNVTDIEKFQDIATTAISKLKDKGYTESAEYLSNYLRGL